jgi:hypothetical protein
MAGGCVLVLMVVAYYCLRATPSVFFTTSSPGGTYSVSLKGDKGRTLLLSHEVKADVLKSGRPFASNIFVHSSHNAFDLSFEAGFPNARWLSDNILEFYRQEYFEKGSDLLIVRNSTNRTVNYMRVQAVNKFLIFDIEPGSSISLQIPAPRGDSQWIALEGAFDDNQKIDFYHKSFDRSSTQRVRFDYQVLITPLGIQIEQ